MRVISCNSPYGQGGIGQHFAYLVDVSREKGMLERYYTNGKPAGDDRGHEVSVSTYGLLKYTPLRFSPSWKSYLLNDWFDRRVASHLELQEADRFMGFTGKALRSFRRAREIGASKLELVAPNSHVENVYALHQQAAQESGITDTWLNRAQLRKTLKEYDAADTIYVHSQYVADSLTARGIPARKLKRTVLPVDSHFTPPEHRAHDDTFRMVYVGRVDATKGIPLLRLAFQRLPIKKAELTIVGGWATRRMRKFMEDWMDHDDRITVAPGDPLPALQEADLYVHPTYEDGLGYAPLEALACGVPVIVTEDTGMKEYVTEGENGFVIPTGDLDALVDRMLQVHRRPLASTSSLLPSASLQASEVGPTAA